MRKKIIQFTALTLSAVLLFTGCHNARFDRFLKDETTTGTEENTSKGEEETTDSNEPIPDGPGSSQNTKNPKDKEFTAEQIEVQESFNKFLDDEYKESQAYSLVSTHFDLQNPENFGITEYESIWGDYTIDDYLNSYDEDKALLDTLLTYDYSALTYEQQLTYDTMKEYLENCLPLDEYFYFSEYFSPASGVQFELPLILSEYSLDDEQDIKDYLTVLENCDEYVLGLLDIEEWRAEKGYALADEAIDEVVTQCNDILSASEPAFLSVIFKVIDECEFVTAEEKEGYKSQIRQLATDNFIPAYQSIISGLTALKGSKTTEGGLSEYEGGEEYYKALVRLYTGSDKTIDELIEVIEADLYDNIVAFSTILTKDPDIYDKLEGELNYTYTEPDEILTNLMSMLTKDFPAPVCTTYNLKYVAESMQSSSNPAFYLIPQYDNYERNIIYVNPNEKYAHMDLFPLLAHEGMPGHMYQNNYFLSLNPHPMRTLMSFGGYAEGWAQYVEYYSYDWSGLEPLLAEAIRSNDRFGFALYSRVDIGVNYEGWNVDDIEDFLSQYTTAGRELAEDLYEMFIYDPATYLQYYIGNLEILELRTKAEDQLGKDFNIKDFHEFFLTVGPTYYDIIYDRMLMWIDEEY